MIVIMASLAVIYYELGRYKEAQGIKIKTLGLRREVFGKKYPDIIRSMVYLA